MDSRSDNHPQDLRETSCRGVILKIDQVETEGDKVVARALRKEILEVQKVLIGTDGREELSSSCSTKYPT